MDGKIKQWRDDGRHLPRFMRDFHDAKDLFKTIHETMDLSKNPYAKDLTWIKGHVYVMDVFLWFMARHGYVLRKTDSKGEFDDIDTTLREARQARMTLAGRLISEAVSSLKEHRNA